MKILMVNKFLYPRGGCETYMLNLAEELKNKGHEVEYFGMYDEKNTVGNSLGLYTTNMDFHKSGAERFLYPFKIIYSTEARRKLGKVLDAFKPDDCRTYCHRGNFPAGTEKSSRTSGPKQYFQCALRG